MILKQFSEKGLNNFKRAYLDAKEAAEKGEHQALDLKSLLSDEYCKVVDKTIELPDGQFKDRYDFAEKLLNAFKGKKIVDKHYYNINMWSFIACYYFEYLCLDSNGKYIGGVGKGKLGDISRVVLDTSSAFRSYRHLIRGPALMVYQTGDFCKKILSRPLTTSGEHYEQVASRRELHCSAGLGILSKVGWDTKTRKWKPGFDGHLDWSIREIALTLNMLAVNYSYYHCETKETLEALYSHIPSSQIPPY